MSDDRAIKVLLLFDSEGGLTEQIAEAVAEGVRSVEGVKLLYRRLSEATASEQKRPRSGLGAAPRRPNRLQKSSSM